MVALWKRPDVRQVIAELRSSLASTFSWRVKASKRCPFASISFLFSWRLGVLPGATEVVDLVVLRPIVDVGGVKGRCRREEEAGARGRMLNYLGRLEM